MATKKTTTTKRKRTVKTTKKAPEMKSFRVAKESTPFLTFRLTKQTIYWLILSAVVVAFTLWLLKLQSDIQDIYNNIDANSSAAIETPSAASDNKKN